jgi:hypothetical protein
MVIYKAMSKAPVIKPDQTPPASAKISSADEVAGFLSKVKAMAPVARPDGRRGRLIFVLDATMSRQATWDKAMHIQSQMFAETAKIGGLDVQLVFFRGFDECRASRWVTDANELGRIMTKVDCRGGHTQINKVLKHIKKENARNKVDAVVFVGDCMEENIDDVCQTAGQVGLASIPVFMFQEGTDRRATTSFKEIARLTRGAHCRFSADAADQLAQLLRAVAIYAAGGRKALATFARHSSQGALLLEQMK